MRDSDNSMKFLFESFMAYGGHKNNDIPGIPDRIPQRGLASELNSKSLRFTREALVKGPETDEHIFNAWEQEIEKAEEALDLDKDKTPKKPKRP